MKKIYSTLVFLFTATSAFCQLDAYAVNSGQPYGKLYPEAPEHLKDFDQLIGRSKCISYQNNQQGVLQDTVDMYWEFKYILNGTAVQDETWKSDGVSATSIRVYNPDSAKWYVSYYASNAPTAKLSVWAGKMEGSDIILWLPQKAPNGLEGFSRLTFYEINDRGFRWKGEWVDVNQKYLFPFWLIDCEKIE